MGIVTRCNAIRCWLPRPLYAACIAHASTRFARLLSSSDPASFVAWYPRKIVRSSLPGRPNGNNASVAPFVRRFLQTRGSRANLAFVASEEW